MNLLAVFGLAFLLAIPTPLAAAERGEKIGGPVVALDGDTLLVVEDGVRVARGTRIRLWGISAPEMRDWPAGAYARAALDELLAGREGEVRCRVVDMDGERPVARCGYAGGTLAEEMIAAGRAVPHRLYTYRDPVDRDWAERYDRAERLARTQARGIWAEWAP